jgi:hypothetical protein
VSISLKLTLTAPEIRSHYELACRCSSQSYVKEQQVLVLRGCRSDMRLVIHFQLGKALLAVILSLVCVLHVLAQEKRQNAPPDSTAKKTQALDALWLYPSSAFKPPLSFKTGLEGFDGFLSQSPATMGSEYGLGFLRQSLASPLPPPWDSQQKLSLATCWTDEFRRQQEYHTFRMILGSIQMGGAAYLAYKHIKNHGFR